MALSERGKEPLWAAETPFGFDAYLSIQRIGIWVRRSGGRFQKRGLWDGFWHSGGCGDPDAKVFHVFGNDNVLAAAKALKENPADSDARGVILYGASISTSGRLGLGKADNYPYEIYEVEFIPEVLFGAAYRKSLTALFPRFLKTMERYHEADIRRYFRDAFGYEGSVPESADKMTELFESLGADMYFDGQVFADMVKEIDIETTLSMEELTDMVKECMVIRKRK